MKPIESPCFDAATAETKDLLASKLALYENDRLRGGDFRGTNQPQKPITVRYLPARLFALFFHRSFLLAKQDL
jgi:hypothetical protein